MIHLIEAEEKVPSSWHPSGLSRSSHLQSASVRSRRESNVSRTHSTGTLDDGKESSGQEDWQSSWEMTPKEQEKKHKRKKKSRVMFQRLYKPSVESKVKKTISKTDLEMSPAESIVNNDIKEAEEAKEDEKLKPSIIET